MARCGLRRALGDCLTSPRSCLFGSGPGAKEFNAAGRHPYKVAAEDAQVAGFAREVSVSGTAMARVVVRMAGHILPADQPRVAKDMIMRFVTGRGFGQ